MEKELGAANTLQQQVNQPEESYDAPMFSKDTPNPFTE